MDGVKQREHHVLALPPTDKDARATREVLASAGITATICADMADLCRQLDFGAGAVLLTDESLKPEGSLAALAAALTRQPKWSDLPLVLLASGGANSPIAMQTLQALQNVLILDRPVYLPTLVSAVRTALRSRQRQYEIRDHLDERRRAEQALARLAAIVESSDDAIVSKNLNGIIQTWNAGAERLFGFRADEIIGQPITLLLPPERMHEEEEILERVRSGRRVTHVETVRVTKDGRRIDVSVTVSPIKDQDGHVIGASKIAHDITERKRAETALLEAKTAAEAANQAKSLFLANISHELRTPMNAILGMIELAVRHAINPTTKDCLSTAKESADILLALLNDLLDSAKIESGNLQLEAAPLRLRSILDQVTRVFSVRASERGLAFYCRTPEDIPDAVVGDKVRLRQVLFNLAGNAIKFTERGEVVVSVRVESQDGEEVQLEFSVRDTGIGIPRDDLDRIFKPFAQADVSTARRFGGTGLGLSISANLVAMMGGRIWAESEPGQGSTFFFTVRLPLAEELPSEQEPSFDIPSAPSAVLRILLVEDNPANQKLATYILKERGHTVEVAGNGQQALRMTQDNRYDVILMDVQMPGMDGLETTAAIRARESGQNRMPIIAMTARAMQGDRERCLKQGMDGYLCKPIEAREMISLIEGVVAGAAPAMYEPTAPTEPMGQTSAAVFDPNSALKRCTGNRDVLAKMAQCFVEEVRNLIPQMRVASEKGDLAEVGRLGHRLKGTIVYLGADPAEKAAVAVEKCQEDGSERAKTQEAVRALEHECELLESAMALYEGTVATPEPPPVSEESLSPVDANVFSLEAATKRCLNQPALLQKMIAFFFKDIDKLLPQMRAALEEGDVVKVGHLGHRLKGTLVILVATRATDAALRVERLTAGGELVEAAEAVRELERECEALRKVLTAYRPAGGPPQDESSVE